MTETNELFELTHFDIVRATVTTMISAPPDAAPGTVVEHMKRASPEDVRMLHGYLALSLQCAQFDTSSISEHMRGVPPLRPGIVDEMTERLIHALWQTQ